MNWQRTFLTGILAAGLMQTSLPSLFSSTAWADDDHDRHYDYDRHHDHDRYHGHDHAGDDDHARWWHEHHESDYDGHNHGDNTRDCRAIRERIHYDNTQVRQIAPTGRHRSALQWYKDDIRNAENDLRTCRR
jgi:hypothetical protein